MRFLALLLAAAATGFAPAPAAPGPAVVEAVEFPYYLYPHQFWERELVWLKNIGVRTVAFSIPWNWHELKAGDYDFTGRTSPRRDLTGLVRLLRRLELRAWIRPLPPVADWKGSGSPDFADGPARRAWLQQLGRLLATQTASHGGPVEFVEGGALAIDAAVPPGPVTPISAVDREALAKARAALARGRGALLWTGVEDALYPEGWAPVSAPLLRHGAIALSGSERSTTAPLRRDLALLRHWGPLLPALRPVPVPKPAAGRFPEAVTVAELTSSNASAVSITNQGKNAFHGELRVLEPLNAKVLVIPEVDVRPGDSLWLPVSVSIGPGGLCRECSNFAAAEHIVYATAELTDIEFENGILAMEFAAPGPAEVVLQLARKPVGPYLAAGKPVEFDWDDHSLRARLKIPASTEPGNRVRIGIAIEEPDTSAFFNEAHRLVIGQKNLLSTVYSSADVAARSRLRLPEGFTASTTVKSPNEIDYQVWVPYDELHGDFASLTLEADGMPLGRARLQLFRPASIRLPDAIDLHFGPESRMAPDPPVTAVEPKAGTNLEILIRNNTPGIQTYHLQPLADDLEFSPPKTEISIGAVADRRVAFRVFAKDPAGHGLCDWRLRVTGGADLDLPMRAILLPRGQTVAWTADLDSDGSAEWVLESTHIRAVFSTQDGGRWLEFTWKDTDTNLLADGGAFAGPGPVDVRAAGEMLEFTGRDWKRTVSLAGNVLTIEQTTPLPPDRLTSGKHGNFNLEIDRPAGNRTVYAIH